MAVSEMASSKSSSNLKPNKIQTAVMSALAAMSLSQTAIAADPIDDANVDNPAGTTITGTAGYGVKLDAGGPYTVANSGEINSTDAANEYGIQLLGPTITSLENTSTGVIKGVATGGDSAAGIRLVSSSNINVLNNAGLISGVADSASGSFGRGIELSKNSTIGTLTNSGTITASAGNSFAVGIYVDNTSTVGTITNSGTITASAGDSFAYGILLSSNSSVTTLTNSGTITAAADDTVAYGIFVRSNS